LTLQPDPSERPHAPEVIAEINRQGWGHLLTASPDAGAETISPLTGADMRTCTPRRARARSQQALALSTQCAGGDVVRVRGHREAATAAAARDVCRLAYLDGQRWRVAVLVAAAVVAPTAARGPSIL
jgi:hypothetical protein